MQLLESRNLPIASDILNKNDAALLIVDSSRCSHSARLLQELEICRALSTPQDRKVTLCILDLKSKTLTDAQRARWWLLGVPCLVKEENVFLGIDAVQECKRIYQGASVNPVAAEGADSPLLALSKSGGMGGKAAQPASSDAPI